MAERSIPIADLRTAPLPPPAEHPALPAATLLDSRARPMRDLRISVTDRCNFRCTYCMPSEVFDRNYAFLPQSALLSFEDIARLARVFVALGVDKLRLTGGEPLLRRNIEVLVGMLAPLQTPDGKPVELTLTTNGSLLPRKAAALKRAGLHRITVSLDALDDAVFRRMNDVGFPVADILEGIRSAEEAGFSSLKINMVVQRGVNDDQILPMARYFKGRGHVVRFIEFMDIGTTNGWRLDDVVPSAEVLHRIAAEFPIEAVGRHAPGEVAERWRYRDGSGEIGVISSVTRAFCRACTRARLSTDGRLYLCLFAERGYDLKPILRDDTTDDVLTRTLSAIWAQRDDHYSEIRGQETAGVKKIEMSYIGG